MTVATDCPSEDLLLELASGRLEDEKASSLHEHIDGCTSCLHVVAELLRTQDGEPSLYPSRYGMLEESARGGQARVLRGFDSLTKREVAIKELLPQHDHSDQALRRFVHEARLTASLTHPGIVPVFDIGFREDGQPFYTMQFVRGKTLAQALRACASLAERLRFLSHFLELCQAVSFAHSRGIVHRDIKPHNVVVGEFGQTMLIDWGLAKLTRDKSEVPLEEGEVSRDPDATAAGAVIGTPAYMSPEQASGRLEDIDERSDVFGLGAVLYEILTGRAPHGGSKVTELLSAARTLRAAPVGKDAPPELAVIVHKALAVDRAERYERAADLAADIEAYLTGGRVRAYEYSSFELLRRLVVRHKRTAIASAVGLMTLVAALAALAVALRNEDRERRRAEISGAQTMIEGAQTALTHRDVLTARARLRTALEITDSLEARSLWRQLSVDPLVWQVRIGSQPSAIALSPGERRFAVAGFLPGVRLIDLDTAQVDVLHTDQVARLTFAAGGRALTTIDLGGRAQRWDLDTRRPTELGDVHDTVRSSAQSPDERTLYILTGAGRLVRLDTASRGLTDIPLSGPPGYHIAVSPDGKKLAVIMESGELRVLDLATGTETPFDCPRRPTMSPSFSPDGTLLGAIGPGGKICLVSMTDGSLRVVDGLAAGGAMAFSPDGARFVVGGADGRVRVFDTASGGLLASLREGEVGGARLPVWTQDGRAVAVVYNAGFTMLYSTKAPPPEPGLGAEPPGVLTSLALSPDGETIIVGGIDGRLRFHDRRSGTERLSVRAHESQILTVAYAPDGRVATGGTDGQVRLWSPEGRHQQTLAGPSSMVTAVSFAGSGRLVSAGTGFHVWDLETGVLKRTVAVTAQTPPVVLGDVLALGHADGSISRTDLATGRELERVSLAREPLDRIAFVDGGRGLAAVTARGEVIVRDAAGAVRKLGEASCIPEGCLLAADPAGTRVAVVQYGRRIIVWDLASGKRTEVAGDAFQGVTFTPDGTHVVGLSPHGMLQLWDVATGHPGWRGPLVRADGDELYTHAGWRSRSGHPIASGSAWRRAVEANARLASERANRLCLATFDNKLEIWDEPRDVRVAQVDVPGLLALEAGERGCVTLAGTTASLVDVHGKVEVLSTEARSILVSGGRILVGLGDRILTVGENEPPEVVEPGLSAMGRTAAGDLLLGFDHGGIQIRRRGGVLTLRDTPSAAVLQLVSGSPALVAAGFTDGTIGLWSATTGQRLLTWWLHGQVSHLSLQGSRLIALTDVGQVGDWLIEKYSLPYCQLLQDVWRAVPVVWEDGNPVVKPTPTEHPCFRAGP